MKKLLYVCEVDSGGITEYSILQSEALAKAHFSVYFLCKSSFPKERLSPLVKVIEFDRVEPPAFVVGKLKTIWRMTIGLSRYSRQIRKIAQQGGFNFILFAFYKEYFSPFWIGPLKQLRNKGYTIGTIAHDPVRDFVIGPAWWHRLCIRKAYSYLDHVFVHDETPVDFGGRKPPGIRVHQIPHGPYELSEPKIGRVAMRNKLGFVTTHHTNTHKTIITDGKDERGSEAGPIPANSHPLIATPMTQDILFLTFGQIRDGKNLDLFLRAMPRLPDNVKLLVAGKGDSVTSRPPEYYQKLAEELGVRDRCRWDIRRIPDEEVGDFFAACDVVLVTYSAKFRSASGVMNAAISARKPVLASSGAGPLKSVVEKYHLGIFVEPDDAEKIYKGASKFIPNFTLGDISEVTKYSPQAAIKQHSAQTPEWDRYVRENSWKLNAALVNSAFVG